MSVKMRSITKEDKARMVANLGEANIKSSPMTGLDKAMDKPNNVVSGTIFGKVRREDDDGEHEYEDRYTRVGYINLAKPVLNQFIAGRKAPVWRKVLGFKQDEIMNIINAKTVLDVEKGELISISSVGSKAYNPEKYLFGTDVLLYFLDKVNIDEVLEKTLIGTFIVPCMTKEERDAYAEERFNPGTIKQLNKKELASALQGDYPGWFYANYALDIENSDFADYYIPEKECTRRDLLLDAIAEKIYERYDTTLEQFSDVDIIIALKRDGVDVLKSQILDYVFVLPYGYRPTIDGRVDALTSQYNKLVNVNQELQDILYRKDPTIYTVLNKYREVVQYVRNIFIGDDDVIRAQHLKDYKSISDTISGKKGLMRDRMQGARIDYSGRSVICDDPTMPIDMIGVPIKMLCKIFEPSIIKDLRNYRVSEDDRGAFRNRNLTTFSQTSSKEKDGITYEEFVWKWFEDEGRYDRYGIVGRQPTLFYLGIQGFRIKPVDGDAIVLSPLVVMPFNADHDGDQMHFSTALTKRGQAELKNNMSFKANMRYPKNGEITVVTRHEIIYGLWACVSKAYAQPGKHYTDTQLKELTADLDVNNNAGYIQNVYNAVCAQRLNVYDTVDTPGGKEPAGITALRYAVYRTYYKDEHKDFADEGFKVKAGDLTARAESYYGSSRDGFLQAINRMVKLGFAVAKVWPPNLSVMIDPAITKHIKEMADEFNEDILRREEYVNLGIEIEEEFSAYFSRKWSQLEKDVIKYLEENVDKDNGYLTMWKSGAKGDASNLRQIFGLIGRIEKSAISTFNCIISGNYSGQITGMDHFITAYGSRKGIADKVLATAEPGYLSRRLEHAGSIITITADDCGTHEGMEFTLEDIVPFLDESQISKYGIYPSANASLQEQEQFWDLRETQMQYNAAVRFLTKIIKGRYVVEPGDNGNIIRINTDDEAKHFIDSMWYKKNYGAVTMRSPVYCKCPCCRVCYGKDIAAGTDLPVVGRPVGFIAAQAIGEPGTQMTMKNFQKGGVVTEANLTSAFELIDDYFELHDFSKKRRNKRGIISYDRLSPVEGYVKVQYLGNGGKRILVTRTPEEEDRDNLIPGTTKIIVQENTVLKDYVRRGDSFQKIQGDLNMREVLKFRGYDKAASYLALNLFSIFKTSDVAFKHFETIVAAMTVFTLVSDADSNYGHITGRYGEGSKMRAGSVLTLPELRYKVAGAGGVFTLLGLKNLPKFKTDFFESMLMENQDSYVPRAIIMNPNDSMSNPITRAAFGLNIGIGTDMQKEQ